MGSSEKRIRTTSGGANNSFGRLKICFRHWSSGHFKGVSYVLGRLSRRCWILSFRQPITYNCHVPLSTMTVLRPFIPVPRGFVIAAFNFEGQRSLHSPHGHGLSQWYPAGCINTKYGPCTEYFSSISRSRKMPGGAGGSGTSRICDV